MNNNNIYILKTKAKRDLVFRYHITLIKLHYYYNILESMILINIFKYKMYVLK